MESLNKCYLHWGWPWPWRCSMNVCTKYVYDKCSDHHMRTFKLSMFIERQTYERLLNRVLTYSYCPSEPQRHETNIRCLMSMQLMTQTRLYLDNLVINSNHVLTQLMRWCNASVVRAIKSDRFGIICRNQCECDRVEKIMSIFRYHLLLSIDTQKRSMWFVNGGIPHAWPSATCLF